MTRLDGLDSGAVDVSKYIAPLQHKFTKYVTKEPEELAKAINEIREFLSTRTPEWIKEPEYDKLNNLVMHGTPQKILYQFDYKNKKLFDRPSLIIDMAMACIPRVSMHLWEQLKIHKQSGMPMYVPSPPMGSPPTMPQQKPSWKDKVKPMLGMSQPKPEEDESDRAVREWVMFADDVQYRYGLWKAWFYGSIKYEHNVGTWSDLNSRGGMETQLANLTQVFDYYIIKRFMMIFNYAVNLELKDIGVDSIEFTNAVARQQTEHEKQNPGMQ